MTRAVVLRKMPSRRMPAFKPRRISPRRTKGGQQKYGGNTVVKYGDSALNEPRLHFIGRARLGPALAGLQLSLRERSSRAMKALSPTGRPMLSVACYSDSAINEPQLFFTGWISVTVLQMSRRCHSLAGRGLGPLAGLQVALRRPFEPRKECLVVDRPADTPSSQDAVVTSGISAFKLRRSSPRATKEPDNLA